MVSCGCLSVDGGCKLFSENFSKYFVTPYTPYPRIPNQHASGEIMTRSNSVDVL